MKMDRNEKAKIKIGSDIEINAGEISENILNELKNNLIFKNPKWLENERLGYWNGETPEFLRFIERRNGDIVIPRGFIREFAEMLNRNYVKFEFQDQTRILPEVEFQLRAKLYDYQERAVGAVLMKRFGVLCSPPGSGKTVMALKIISERRQPALVVVHSKELLYQWQERAASFLGLAADEIGLIGDGKNQVGGRLTIAIVNSLLKNLESVKDRIGFLIVDECHRTPAKTFTEVVKRFDCRYLLGLSATPYRRDGLTKVIHLFLGEQVHCIDARELQKKERIMTAELITRETNFDYYFNGDYQKMLRALVNDSERNFLILNDISRIAQRSGVILVLSDRKEHCRFFYDKLIEAGIKTRLLTGAVGSKQRKQIVSELNGGGVKVLVATSQLIGEGFDLKALSAIFLTTPIKFSGRLKQYIGRILRTAPGKDRAIIYDYVDRPGVLRASFRARLGAYKDYNVAV